VAEEVTDLTEEEVPEDNAKGKKSKEKKAKKGKEPKDAAGGVVELEGKDSADGADGKGKKGKEPKVKAEKRGGAGGIILLMALVLVILLGGFGAALYFDALGTRIVVGNAINDPLLDLVAWLDPNYNTIEMRQQAEAEAQEIRFRERIEELNAREIEIEYEESLLLAVEEQLDRRALELDNREAQLELLLDRTIPLHRRNLTEDELENIVSLSGSYTQMSPETAANILVAMHDPRDAASILYFMSERNRGAIMAAMDIRFAAHITEILLSN
jgi:flagellar motility protein MotE (MotC chaperone)